MDVWKLFVQKGQIFDDLSLKDELVVLLLVFHFGNKWLILSSLWALGYYLGILQLLIKNMNNNEGNV